MLPLLGRRVALPEIIASLHEFVEAHDHEEPEPGAEQFVRKAFRWWQNSWWRQVQEEAVASAEGSS